MDTSENRSEIPLKFLNAMLEKDGEDMMDRSCEKWRSVTYGQGRKEYPTYNNKKKVSLDWSQLLMNLKEILKKQYEEG
jgi:hypothetical protein